MTLILQKVMRLHEPSSPQPSPVSFNRITQILNSLKPVLTKGQYDWNGL
jgi:hypothetical protein